MMIILTSITVIFCLYPVSFACSIENSNSGEISGSYDGSTYESNCWIIPVPEDMYVTLQIEDFNFKGDCSEVHLEVFADDQDKLNTFCNMNFPKMIITALNNVTIYYNHNDASWGTKSYFSLKYFKESIMCTRGDHFRCSEHQCIHKSQICDRIDDCENAQDEFLCERGIVSVEGANSTQAMALRWLTENDVTHGWDKDTHRAITALYLVQRGYEFKENTLEGKLKKELMTKELELRTLVALLRNSSEPISVSELSMFVNALIVTCHNPRQFYGYDLIRIMYERVSVTETPCPGVYLTLCNSDWILSLSDVTNLFELLQKNSYSRFFIDIQAMTIMALSCIKNKYEEYEHLFNDSSIYNETIEHFIEMQLPDGSFGNVYTTALITQALISSGQESNRQWDISSTVNYYKHYFDSTSTIDFLVVYLTLPVFSSRSLVDIGNVNCTNSYRKLEENDISDVTQRLDERMFIQYSLFIGDDRDIVHTIYLKMPKNSSAYDLMRVAQATDSKYRFLHIFTLGGIHVYQIASITNDPEAGKFWLLYTQDNKLKTLKSHIESPDKLVLNDGAHLVMWYRTTRI